MPAYLVRLMIVLGVVFKDLWFFRVFKGTSKVVGSKLLSPFFAFDEPEGRYILALFLCWILC